MNTAIVTGTTGGIGGATAKLLGEKGWELFLPVRSAQKAAEIFGSNPQIHITQCDLTSYSGMEAYAGRISQQVTAVDLVILAAGGRGPKGEFYDSKFPGATENEKHSASIEGHLESSVRTKKTVVYGLYQAYGKTLKETTLVMIGSHAADFSPEEALHYSEVGYVHAMQQIRNYAKELIEQNIFKKVILLEPGLVRTSLTTEELPDALANPDNNVTEPEDYAAELLGKTGLF